MSLNISAWSIRRPLPAIVVSFILVTLGAISFGALPITRLPSVDVPIVSVAVAQFGAAPQEINDDVTKPIEDALSGVEGVHHIISNITDGLSTTVVQFQLDADTDRALNDVKDAVTRVRSRLPQDIVEPLIQRVDIVGLPTVTYAASSAGMTPQALSYFVDDVVKRDLQGLKGVGQVERIGGVEREVSVSLDPDRLQAFNLTAADVGRQLRGTKVDVAGGRAEIGGEDQAIRTLAAAQTVEEVAASVIVLPAGGQIRLDDLGRVRDGIAEPRTFARVDGKPVVGFDVLRAKGASDVGVAAAVADKVRALHDRYPDVDLTMIDSSTDFTVGNYHAALQTLFEGAALAVLVVLIFLRDWRATLIAAVTLPLSIIPAFWAMHLIGFSLNLVSFMAITLSTGILVDDSIVEIENIERHMAMGKTPYQASIDAADEIGPAVIAISLTIIAVFVPVSFMGSVAGQFFKQFGVTISVQVFFSLLAARFVTPMLAAYFLKPRPHGIAEAPGGVLARGYARMLRWVARHQYITVMLGLVAFALSLGSTQLLPSGFLPAQDVGRSVLAVELPPGSSLATTAKVTEAIAARLRQRPEVRSVFVDGGHVPPGTSEVRLATLIIDYTPKEERSTSQHDLELSMGDDLSDVPDVRHWFLDENGMRGVALVVTGQDGDKVRDVAGELATEMRGLASVSNVVAATSLDRPELRIRPRPYLAARLGASAEGLSETVRIATIGDVEPALAKMNTPERQVPIRVQLDQTVRADRQRIAQLRVPLPGGHGSVPLESVADVTLEDGPISITRYDRERQAGIGADLVGTAVIGEAMAEINKLPVMQHLPPGVEVRQSGDAESMKDLQSGFTGAMRDGLMVVFAVLVILFGGVFQPITILFSLPLSVGGAFLGLLVTHRPLSVPVFIGILMLMGIVTKNAIMLVDFTILAIRHGAERRTAVVEAGCKRARPIVMTTVAMVAGMLPSALAHGAGGEIRSPMAIAVIGGLLVSTLLSLVFVPAVYLAMDDLSRLCGRVFSPLTTLGKGGAGRRLEPVPYADAGAEPGRLAS
jgi:hydrophobe/amphiphile efflux-1 (HAE1) family protein